MNERTAAAITVLGCGHSPVRKIINLVEHNCKFIWLKKLIYFLSFIFFSFIIYFFVVVENLTQAQA